MLKSFSLLHSIHHHLSVTSSLGACFLFHTSHPSVNMDLQRVTKVLDTIAPLKAAEPWDNVGLLLEPSTHKSVERLVITNDLTEGVLDEILKIPGGKSTGLVISYHPPLFKPLKRLTQGSSKERIVVRALEAGVAVYSPHTALDNMEGGINDWLLSGIGEGEVAALGIHKHPSQFSNVLQLKEIEVEMKRVENMLSLVSGIGKTTLSTSCVEIECTDEALAVLMSKTKTVSPSAIVSVRSSHEVLPTLTGGKLLTLHNSAQLSVIVKKIKSRLKLDHLRLARPYKLGGDPLIKTVAVCAGSGGSVLEGVRADLLLSGEMSHHQVLGATAMGSAVILCDHSNTERGFLQGIYRERVETALGSQVEVAIATTDKDPLEIV